MLLDVHEWAGSRFRDTVFDVCVCGAGPAGITLARQLASKGHTVALMESGGLQQTEESQRLYQGDNIGQPYYPLDACRLRYLGGTSNHWDGVTRPLDARDFEPLPHHPLNEWPIGKHDLDPYAEAAASILDLGPAHRTLDMFKAGGHFFLAPAYYRMSAPTRFGEKYRDELTLSHSIALCLNASLFNIELVPGLGAVSRLAFRPTSGSSEQFFIRARFYALCCGGLENARILLNADEQVPKGIGNANDLVGRFFNEHIEAGLGRAILTSPLLDSSTYIVTDAHLSKRQCLSYVISFAPEALKCESESFVDRLKRALRGQDRKCFDCTVELQGAQQAMNRDSRVTLSDKRDRFGLRQLALNWQLGPLDVLTVRSAALDAAEALARHNIGRMQVARFLRSEPTVPELAEHCVCQNHHMCTTRMSDAPQGGVVDADCCVHGMNNLYIGGSSVFSSGGVSNPTFTIVQLALRLGDHLHQRLV